MTKPSHCYQACIQPEGKIFDASPDQSLLKSIDDNGIYWPRSCRNGTCRTCIAKLIEGNVQYEVEWPGLSAEEKQQGWILPCVARPLTDVVIQDPLAD